MKSEKTNSIKRLALTAVMLLGCVIVAVAQQVVTGNVTDAKFKEPVIGVNVVLVNTQNRYVKGTVTDIDGNYSLQVPKDAKNLSLQVSYIGMKTIKVKYVGQSKVNFQLQDDSKTELREVTVTSSRRDNMGVSKMERTSSMQTINMTEIVEATPVSSIEEALQGQIAGLDITMGGDPGAKNTMQIRGTNTLTGNSNPLIVVDGVPYDTDIDESFDFSTANSEDFGALLNISPSNIESIDVLKDGAATAIYGSKGSNGVLLINTKKGTMGKTSFNFTSKWTVKQEPSSIPLLNGRQYTAMMQDALWNAANAKGVTNASAEMDMLFNAAPINYNPNYQYYDEYNQDTNWLEEVKQSAWISDNNFSMSGGGEKARYRFSLGYYDETGTTRGTGLNRLNSQLRVTYNFSDRLRVHTDFSYTNSKRDDNVISTIRSEAQRSMPNKSPYWIDDVTGLPTDQYFSLNSDYEGEFDGKKNKNYNPVAMTALGFNKLNSREEKMTITLEYDFPFHLRFQGWVSLFMKTTKNNKFLPQAATGVLMNDKYANCATDASSDSYSLQSEARLIYSNVFNKVHGITATAIYRTTQTEANSTSNVTYGNASADLSDPVIGSAVQSANSAQSERRMINFTGQMVYSYDSRYVLKGTFNYEGNSSMGRNNRFATYPALGLAWNVEKEHFWSEGFKKVVNEAKLRASLAWTGKSPSGSSLYYGAFKSLGSYVTNAAIYPSRMQLDNLKWSSTREWDFGVDLRLFDRFNFTFDYYDKLTTDLLQKDTSLPYTTGYKTLDYMNSGELSNKGFEVRFDYEAIKKGPWYLKVHANASRNVNTVEKLPSNYKQESYTFNNGNYALRIEEGKPIGAFYGYRYKGVYQNANDTYAKDASGNVMYDINGKPIVMRNGTTLVYPGDAKYEDINNDGVINEKDIVYLGNANPKMIFGGGFTLKWKDLSLTTLFYGRLGQKVINQARMNLENMHGVDNQSTAVLNRWRSEGDDTDIPRALYGMGYNYLGSDRFVEDATYVRLKTLTLSYNVPKKFLQKLKWGISSLKLTATGYDLFTFTNYSGQEPEVGMPSATSLVMDKSTTPISKRYVFNLNVTF